MGDFLRNFPNGARGLIHENNRKNKAVGVDVTWLCYTELHPQSKHNNSEKNVILKCRLTTKEHAAERKVRFSNYLFFFNQYLKELFLFIKTVFLGMNFPFCGFMNTIENQLIAITFLLFFPDFYSFMS